MTQRQPLTSAQAILYGTLVAGTLDILDALIVSGLRGVTPLRLFQYIAAGLLGRDAARAGGLATAFLGGFLHYFIAFGAVVVYFVASRKIPFLTRRPWIVGPIYGALVYLFMNLVVLPLSALHRAPDFTPSLGLLNQLLIHTFGIGVPCALFARAARPSAPRPEAVLVA